MIWSWRQCPPVAEVPGICKSTASESAGFSVKTTGVGAIAARSGGVGVDVPRGGFELYTNLGSTSTPSLCICLPLRHALRHLHRLPFLVGWHVPSAGTHFIFHHGVVVVHGSVSGIIRGCNGFVYICSVVPIDKTFWSRRGIRRRMHFHTQERINCRQVPAILCEPALVTDLDRRVAVSLIGHEVAALQELLTVAYAICIGVS